MSFELLQPSVTINASHNLVAYVGDDLSIDCVVASWSQTNSNVIAWLKNECEIDYEGSSPPETRVFYSASHFDKIHCRQFMTLNIRKLTFTDSGNYSCIATYTVSDYPMVVKSILLTVTVPMKQPNYKSLILKISIPISVVIIILAISVALGTYYYQQKYQIKLQKALEEYQKRPLPRKG